MRRIACSVAGCFLVVCAGQATPPQTTTPQFGTTTDLVVLDVSVLDKNRRPIRGLTASDFTITDRGQPQTVTSFAAVDVPDPPAMTAQWMREARFDVQNNRAADGRLFVLYMDDRGAGSLGIQATRDAASAFIDHLAPGDLAAVVFPNRYQNSQEFTNDRVRLRAAVAKYDVFYGPMTAIRGLRDLERALAAVPHRQKIIVYFGPGQEFDPLILARIVRLTEDTGSNDMVMSAAQRDFDDMIALYNEARRANVVIYAVDMNGLSNHHPASTLLREFMQIISGNTGGQAILNTNEPAHELERVFAENGSYYLLGYQPADARAEGRFRRIAVKVNRPDVIVRARTGYMEPRANAQPTPAPVGQALSALVPKSDLPVRLHASALSAGVAGKGTVALTMGVDLAARDAPATEHVDIGFSIFDDEGKMQASETRGVAVSPTTAAGSTFTCQILARVDLRPGHYDVRVSAHSQERGVSGSVFGDVVVPDFSKEALALSGVFIETSPAPASVPKAAFEGLIPIVPAARREFQSRDTATAYLQIYQGGRAPAGAVTVKTVVLDQRDAVIAERAETFAPDRFGAGRPAEYRFPLPLNGLAPGLYLLRIEAAAGARATVRRDVRFEVTGR